VGIDLNRLALKWASAAEAPLFVQIVTDFTENIKKLGPLGEKEGISPEDLKFRLKAARKVAENMRFRTAIGNIARELKKMGDYAYETIAQKIDEKITPLVKKLLLEEEVKELLKRGPASIDTLLQKTGASSDDIVPILESLAKKGKLEKQGDLWQPKAKE